MPTAERPVRRCPRCWRETTEYAFTGVSGKRWCRVHREVASIPGVVRTYTPRQHATKWAEYKAGKAARRRGEPRAANPWDSSTHGLRQAWLDGWLDEAGFRTP